MLPLSLLSVLALNASAMDDPAPGDRVEITFASGATLVGTVVKPKTPPRERVLMLDLAPEYPGVTGTLTIPRRDLKAIRKVRIPVEPWVCDLTNPPRIPAAVKPPPPAPVDAPEPPAPTPAPEDPKAKAEEELRKAREVFAKFPAPDWSPERRNAIRLKKLRGQVPTPAEREFDENFDLWVKGRDASTKK